ncbi:hypothetical protein MTBBW1_2650003 [Desulfamplus magnetovallimortis]|uniref:Sulfotransferase family protein n=1 Tax=Desulfamplus magnetovallimortis TaxID=1246637 RepID=A0A1W1HF58_9BACT|nr:sulfotransferase family 2 domain-containing protein [Desulfamplus magnetovallimortis]SLM31066.1 hypothetical protein MTBBW1_2650003 [Desulfamplus magnetovallimortis]
METFTASPATSILIFNHIPKCGGSSLKKSLRSIFGDNFHEIRYHRNISKLDNKKILTGNHCIAGHFCTGINHIFPKDIKLKTITILRHPFELFISYYKMNAQGFMSNNQIESYLCNYQNNILLYYLGVRSVKEGITKLRQYTCFGLQEQYNDSLTVFEKIAGVFPLSRKPSNVSFQQPIKFDHCLKEKFYELNIKDILFYEDAAQYFNETYKKIFSSNTSAIKAKSNISQIIQRPKMDDSHYQAILGYQNNSKDKVIPYLKQQYKSSKHEGYLNCLVVAFAHFNLFKEYETALIEGNTKFNNAFAIPLADYYIKSKPEKSISILLKELAFCDTFFFKKYFIMYCPK